LNAIAVELSKQGQLEESLAIARGISDDYWKNLALNAIAVELSKQGQVEESVLVMQESLAIARGISVEWGKKSRALNAIAVEFSKQGNFSMAEAVGLEITQIASRQNVWREISKSRVEAEGWQNALRQVELFQSEEAKIFYLKGWAENVVITDATDFCIQEALPKLTGDNVSIEKLMQKYAAQQILIGIPSSKLTDRLNRTLNIQWALDIKRSLSAN
jgi:hypothetical protein